MKRSIVAGCCSAALFGGLGWVADPASAETCATQPSHTGSTEVGPLYVGGDYVGASGDEGWVEASGSPTSATSVSGATTDGSSDFSIDWSGTSAPPGACVNGESIIL
jgi:hypothetical protein